MESVLLKIVNECGSSGKHVTLKNFAQEAYDILIAQQGNPLSEMHELREKCLAALEQALETTATRFASYGLEGLQSLLRDNQLHTLEGVKEHPDETLPMQVLYTLHSLPNWNQDPDMQCHCLTVVLQVVCSNSWVLSSKTVVTALELCIATFVGTRQVSVRMAARATVSQILNSYCTCLYKEQAEDAADADFHEVFDEVTTLLTFCNHKLSQMADSLEHNPGLLLSCDACFAILSVQTSAIQTYEPFLNLIWICGELLRLLGPVKDMRSVLEALFHRFLLFPPANKRCEALRVLKKVLSYPERVVDLCLVVGTRTKENEYQKLDNSVDHSSDLSLWKIVLDSLVESSQCSDVSVSVLAVECVDNLLVSLEQLSDDTATILQPHFVTDLNLRFGNISSSDHENVCMRSVADRIGSALKKYESHGEKYSDVTDESRKHLLRVRSAVSEEQTKQKLTGNVDGVKDEARARRFLEVLSEKIICWGSLKSIIEVDEAVQMFSSEYCQDFMEAEEATFQQSGNTNLSFLNADAVYLATFSSLRLSYRLNQIKYYEAAACQSVCPFTEREFVSEVLRPGCIVYATESWVAEIYRQLLKVNILDIIESYQGSALVNMIQDYDGEAGGLLKDVQRLNKARKTVSITMHCSAARKICRRILTASWDGLMVILSSLVEIVRSTDKARSLPAFLFSLKRKSATSRHRERAALLADGLAASLGGLQKLAHLCNTLGLQSRSGWIFSNLVQVSCPLDELRSASVRSQFSFKLSSKADGVLSGGGGGGASWLLRIPDVLSIDIVVSSAAETASYAPDCWKHIIRCCEYVWELERFLFAEKQEKGKAGKKPAGNKVSSTKAMDRSAIEDLESPLGFGIFVPKPFQESLSDVVAEYQKNNMDNCDLLDKTVAERIVCLLLTNVDTFFETASRCLNMKALEEFCEALVTASQDRLFYSLGGGLVEPWFLCHRLTMTLIRSCESGRPLSHLIRIWTIAAAHFIEASCSKDPSVARKAVSCLHESILCFLSKRGEELEGFHFNESLFLPFQTVLCLEMSEGETQDQIVSVLAEFVESYPELIHSGWKPLFGALKAVKASGHTIVGKDLSSAQIQRISITVLDVLDAFLKMENWNVFCLAALDCISCLLNYLQAPTHSVSGTEDDGEESEEEWRTEDHSDSVYPSVLSSIRRLHGLLSSLFTMNKLPVFHLLHRLMLRERSIQSVDSQLPNIHLERIGNLLDLLDEKAFFGDKGRMRLAWIHQENDYEPLSVPWTGLPVTQLAILESWLTLIEGVVSAVVTCPRQLQPDVLQVLDDILQDLLVCPGLKFGTFCLVHQVFPMIQQWLRREARFSSGWRENRPSVRNFKQAVGLTTHLTVSYIKKDAGHSMSERLLADMCSLLTQCVSQPSEVVSRLGCSCLRHLILSCATSFQHSHWSIICRVLWRNIVVSLHPVRVLMSHFMEGSELQYFGTGENQYYGDCGKVQVALRKDSNPREAQRIRTLAQQVFLLDSQKFVQGLDEKFDALSQSCRSVILLLQSETNEGHCLNSDLLTLRLPFRDIVIGLLSHQLLLQLIGSILLEGTNLVVSGVSSLLMKQVISPPTPGSVVGKPKRLPGYLNELKSDHLAALFLCLEASFQVAFEFDERPGLKFLVQKVFNSNVAANLYKQAVTSWTIKAVSLFELGHSCTVDYAEIKKLMDGRIEISWFDQQKSAQEVGDECLQMVSSDYLRITRQLCGIEKGSSFNYLTSLVRMTRKEYGGYLEADRAASAVSLEPFVFLLASNEQSREADTNREQLQEQEEQLENSEEDEINRELKGSSEEEEKVYCMVTNETVSAVLAEFKRHKQKTTMPPPTKGTSAPSVKSHNADSPVNIAGSEEPPQGEQQQNGEGAEEDTGLRDEQTESVLKDSEARCLAWAEMAVGILQLVLVQPESDFRRLLPVVYPAAVQLAAGSGQQRIRQTISDLLYNLNEVYEFLHCS